MESIALPATVPVRIDASARLSSRQTILIHCAWLLGLILLAPIAELAPPETLLRPVCVLIAVQTFWLFWSWRNCTGRLFDPYGLFILATALFNCSYAFILAFGLEQQLPPLEVQFILNAVQTLLLQRLGAELALQTFYLILISCAALHFGALLGIADLPPTVAAAAPCPSGHFAGKAVAEDAEGDDDWFARQGLFTAGLLLLLIAAVPLALNMRRELTIAQEEGYSGLYQEDQATGVDAWSARLARYFVPAALLLLASAGRPGSPAAVLALLLIAAYAAGYCAIGSRVRALNALLACAMLWHWRIRRIPAGAIAAGALAVLLLIPLIALSRQALSGQRFSGELIRSALLGEHNPVVHAVLELGATAQITIYTLYQTPASWDFQWGKGYLYSALAVVPNLFWELHPAAAYEGLATHVVWLIAPDVAARGSGLGSNFIAEAYFEFGWYGILFLAAFGFFAARLTGGLFANGRPLALAALACMLPGFLYLTRNSFTLFFREEVWYALAPALLAWFCGQLRITIIPTAKKPA